MTGEIPGVYEGDRDYVFVCYSHFDRNAVLPIVAALVEEGFRVWYDDGIELATEYPKKIADHVYGCAFFILFVSRASLGSRWCNDEVNYALDLGKAVLPVFLEEVELTRDLQMRMGRVQSIFWYKLTGDVFYARLFGVRRLRSCLTDEGKQHWGVQPKEDVAGAADPLVRTRAEGNVFMQQAVPKAELAEYSWAELKELSQTIAAARSDAEGLDIARQYHLVDKDGKLQGDEKPLELKNGTKTSVRILGFRHDELAGGGKAGISFEFTDVPMVHRMNSGLNSVGGWKASAMRTWLNSEFFALLPDDLHANISEVRKWTNNAYEISLANDVSMAVDTVDSIWLLSVIEVYGRRFSTLERHMSQSLDAFDVEGTQYQLYDNKKATFDDCLFCRKGTENSIWWLRSPSACVPIGFYGVDEIGVKEFGVADHHWGVSPGFCF